MRRMVLAALCLLCLLSGMAGLSYEVIWLRVLATIVGSSAAAGAAVLAAMMGGMGIGAWVGGRFADRTSSLRLFAGLEIGLGVFAFLVPTIAEGVEELSPPLLAWVGTGALGLAARLLLAVLVVLIPAGLMGATLPTLTRTLERELDDRADAAAGLLYSLNTAGAALGAALTGYWLLATYGTRATTMMAGSIDIAIGGAALMLSRSRPLSKPRRSMSTGMRAPLVLAALSGAVFLGLEVIWTRLLTVVFGHDVHAFTSMLVAVLVGLAVGAGIYRSLPARIACSVTLPAALLGALGSAALLMVGVTTKRYLAHGTDTFALDEWIYFTESHHRGMAQQLVFASVMIVLPAILSGALLPALVAQHRRRARGGQRSGEVFAANTLGGIVGALGTPWLLVGPLGIRGALLALASAASIAGAATWIRSRSPDRLRATLLLFASFTLSFTLVPAHFSQQLLAQKMGPEHLEFLLYEEGPTGTVAVVRNRIHGERQLLINGINEVTTRLVHDQSFALLGHLGPLLHSHPQRVGVICLGGGLSAGAVSTHRDVEEIDIVDLQPTVALAAQQLSDLNHDVLHDGRVELINNDGRNHLRTHPNHYDVLTVDSTHPRALDSWMLYTSELYETAQAALRQGGVFVQWVPLHGLTVDEWRIIAGTFVDTFEDGSLWVNAGFERYGLTGYGLLVSRSDIDIEQLRTRISAPEVLEDLRRWGLGSAEEVLECFVAGPDALRRWSLGAPRNRDSHPFTERLTRFAEGATMTPAALLEVHEPVQPFVSGPVNHFELSTRVDAQRLLLAGRLEAAQERCPDCAKYPLYVQAMSEGREYYLDLREYYPDDPARRLEIAGGLVEHSMLEQARDTLQTSEHHVESLVHLGLVEASLGEDQLAEGSFRKALERQPAHTLARMNLGLCLLRQARIDEGTLELEEAARQAPDVAAVRAAVGWARMHQQGQGVEAEYELRQALAIDRRHPRARVALGRLLLMQGRVPEAIATLETGRAFHPFDEDLLFTLGAAYQQAETL